MLSNRESTYRCWANMRYRCRNKRCRQYSDYGGRGISVCERWNSFENFFYDMGEKPEGKFIGRQDNDGNYEPGNCKWETSREQNRNKRDNVFVTFKDKTMCVSVWAEALCVTHSLIYSRIRSGWTTEKAIKTYPCRWDKVFPQDYHESWEVA